MSGWLAASVAVVGLAITGAGVVGVNVVFFRSMPKLIKSRSAAVAQRREGRDVSRDDQRVAFESALGLMLFTAVAAIGLTIMLLGLALGGSAVKWAPLAPLAVVVLAIGGVAYSGLRLRQLGNG